MTNANGDDFSQALERAGHIVSEWPAWKQEILGGTARPNPSDVVTCVFCGKEYPPDTPTSQHRSLYEHIKGCDKHPMSVAIGALDTLANTQHKLPSWTIAKNALDKIEQMCQ